MSVRQRSSAIHLRAIIARCARLAARLDAAGLKNNHRGLREHGEQNEKQKKQTKKDRRAQYMTRVRQNCQREPESLVTSWISQCLPGSAGTMHEGGLLIAIPAKHADFTAVSRMQRPVTPFLPHNLNMNLTGIVTDEWNRLLAHCVETGWQCVFSYDMFDKGIDYDLYILVRSGEDALAVIGSILLYGDNYDFPLIERRQ